jgi:N,N'-diacetyllegionaminate synthase
MKEDNYLRFEGNCYALDKKLIQLGKFLVGEGQPCFIIAEAGVNHDGNIEKAKQLVDIAAASGANAIKFQTFTGEKLASKDAQLATYHKKGSVSENEDLKSLLKRLELSREEHQELFKYARDKGIMIFSTPFDEDCADFLESLNVDLFKIASFSLTNYPLLRHVAKKNKPIIMSVGLHTLGEVEEALEVIYSTGNRNVILLQCTSHYPSQAKDANLKVMETLSSAFKVPVGYSDHTMGINITLAAVAREAKVIEKHFTFDIDAFGVDHDASISPKELINMVNGIREIEQSLGNSIKIIPEIEKEIQRVHRPSIVSKTNIPTGTIISEEMLCIKKPGTGIHPRHMNFVVGKVANVDIEGDRLIKKEHLS